MSCPTCGHAMTALHQSRKSLTWVCDRCGTIKRNYRGSDFEDIYVPKLVERCREYEKGLLDCGTPSPSYLGEDWQRLGIADAINKPEDRP